MRGSRRVAALIASLATGAAVGALVHAYAPPPVAAPALGTDEAFSAGRYRRLVTGGGLQRWTGRRDAFRFEHLPGPATAVLVTVHNDGPPIDVVVKGLRVGSVAPGHPQGRFELPATIGRDVSVELHATPPEGSPGGLVERVALEHAPGRVPDPVVLALFAFPALAACAGALLAGLSAGAALGATSLALGLLVVTLGPDGVVRSPWAGTASLTLGLGMLACGALARLVARRHEGFGPAAFGAGAAALVVQGLAAVSPLMPVSDAMFHAHKLFDVAGGNLFPESLTQHATPFRFPYGVAFYVPLVPFLRSGYDPIATVRWAAALVSLAASAALFGLLIPAGRARALIAVLALQVLPVTFSVHSYGNLSNVFGQAVTVLFFAWFAGRARGGAVVGAILVAVASLAHFSSCVVLGVLGLGLLVVRWRTGTLDRTRLVAVVAGLALAGVYYASFLPMVLEQLPRLAEGGGSGRVSRGLLGEAWDEVRWLRVHWALPAIVMAAFGLPRPSRSPFDRDLVTFWGAGAVLALLALVTPVEVRYVYALTLPMSIAMAEGLIAIAGRGTWGVLVATALGLAQALVAIADILDAVLARYR